MEKKIKLIAVVLGALCLGALGLAFSYITKYNKLTGEYQQLEKEKQDLHVENNRITQKAAKAEEEVSRIEGAGGPDAVGDGPAGLGKG